MKILQLGKFYPVRGGVEKVMWDITHALVDEGIDCQMLCACIEKDAPAPEPFIHTVKAWKKVAGTMIAPGMISWMKAHANEFDIVHVHHPDPMAALALRTSGFGGKVVLHWHSDIVSQKTFLKFYKPLQGWLIRRSDIIIGTTPVYVPSSPWLKDVQAKCRTVPIGVEPLSPDDGKVRALRARYQGRIIILSVGRLVPYKGYPYLIESMRHLPEDYHLVIVGIGPMEEKLRKRITALGLESRITILNWLSDDELCAYFGACDVFVLPSTMRTEAFGIVQAEAMSVGKPVVSTRIPGSGVPWVNQDRESGITVIPEDPIALAQAIERAFTNREQLGKGALQRYRTHFQISNMIKTIKEIYETLS